MIHYIISLLLFINSLLMDSIGEACFCRRVPIEKGTHKHGYSIQFYSNVNNNYKSVKTIENAAENLAFSSDMKTRNNLTQL